MLGFIILVGSLVTKLHPWFVNLHILRNLQWVSNIHIVTTYYNKVGILNLNHSTYVLNYVLWVTTTTECVQGRVCGHHFTIRKNAIKCIALPLGCLTQHYEWLEKADIYGQTQTQM